MQKYKKIWYLWGLLRIMRIIFKNATLPENLAGLVFVFNAITFVNIFLIS